MGLAPEDEDVRHHPEELGGVCAGLLQPPGPEGETRGREAAGEDYKPGSISSSAYSYLYVIYRPSRVLKNCTLSSFSNPRDIAPTK